MGLLTDPSTSPKNSKLVKILIGYNRFICAVLYLAGVCLFCALAHRDLNNGTYFSENALLPGLVYSEIHKDSAIFAKSLLDELKREREEYSGAVPFPWLLAKMRQIGLETHTHNFTLNYPLGGMKTFKGKNVYGILRAPRAASTESFVISVPYRPPDSLHPDITAGIPLVLAFAEFARSMYLVEKNVFPKKT